MKSTFKLGAITVKGNNVEYISTQSMEYGVDVASSPFEASIEEVAVVQESTATEFITSMKEVSKMIYSALEEQRNIDRIRNEQLEKERKQHQEDMELAQKEHDEYIQSLQEENNKFQQDLEEKRKARIKPSFTREEDSYVGDAASFKF